MNKQDLATQMVKDSGLSKAAAVKVIDALVDAITDELKNKDGKVTLVGFGTFKVIRRAAKTGRNPKTKEAIKIPAKNVVKFVPGKKLKDLVE